MTTLTDSRRCTNEENRCYKKYFSELIGDVYKSWDNTRVILDGGTGTGKTYFTLKRT